MDMPSDMPEFLRHLLSHAGGMGRVDEDIDPTLPIIPRPDRVDHPINSRVTLTPESKKRYKFPKEPNYGKLVYKAPGNLLFPRDNDPNTCPDYWDCVVAVAPNDNEPTDIKLFAFHSSQLRIPVDANLDINEAIDKYALIDGRQFMIGDEICVNPECPEFDGFRAAKYPCKAVVEDIFAGSSFMGKNVSTALEQVDLVFRCVVNNDGDCRTFYGFSGNFILYSEAVSRN
jgi:hypothetical protein